MTHFLKTACYTIHPLTSISYTLSHQLYVPSHTDGSSSLQLSHSPPESLPYSPSHSSTPHVIHTITVEFAQLMKQQQAAEGVATVVGKQASSSAAKSPASSSSSQTQAGGKVKGKGKGGDGKGGDADSEAVVLAELAAMGSTWDDNDEEGGGADWGDDEDEEEVGITPATTAAGKKAKLNDNNGGDGGLKGGSGLLARARTGSEVGLDQGGYVLDRRPMSRIIHRKTALPRCKLVAFLLREYPDYNHLHHGRNNHRDGFFTEEATAFVEGSASTFGEDNDVDDVEDGPILEYLKQLPPPAGKTLPSLPPPPSVCINLSES